jgi:ubiquinone/menaquinone biosynthesis C-methylase UbiE
LSHQGAFIVTDHYLPAMGHDRLLPLYDPYTRLLGVPALHDRLVDQAGIGPGQRVLEVGCGPGNLVLRVQHRHPDVEVIGLDPDPRALALARRKAERRGAAVRWDRGTAADLPYPDGSIDRVLSAFMFHHLDEAEKGRMLAEVRRVLRPDGRLHLVDVGGHHGLLGKVLHRNPRFRGQRILDRLREAGFTDVVETDRARRLSAVFYRATA